jgi:hypothetical protein
VTRNRRLESESFSLQAISQLTCQWCNFKCNRDVKFNLKFSCPMPLPVGLPVTLVALAAWMPVASGGGNLLTYTDTIFMMIVTAHCCGIQLGTDASPVPVWVLVTGGLSPSPQSPQWHFLPGIGGDLEHFESGCGKGSK